MTGLIVFTSLSFLGAGAALSYVGWQKFIDWNQRRKMILAVTGVRRDV